MTNDIPCRTRGCHNQREASWHLLCPRCWHALRPATQDRVLTEYRNGSGSEAHFAACSDARREATEALAARREFMEAFDA